MEGTAENGAKRSMTEIRRNQPPRCLEVDLPLMTHTGQSQFLGKPLVGEAMLNIGLRISIFLLFWVCAFNPQTSCAQDALHEIEEVEARWRSAIASGDRSTYDELLADDFSWTFVSGRMINRQQMIESIGPVDVTVQDKTIRVYENSAVVTGIASLIARGRPLTERFVRVWIKDADGDWQLAYFQATEIE